MSPAATLAAPPSSPAPPRLHPSRLAQVRGRKVFELFHPAEGAGPLYDGQKMRSKHLLWRWRAEAMRGDLMSLDPSKMEATHVPFSPVRLRRPDLAAHPAFTSSRRLLCEVGEGDVLYVPSCAPHRALGRQGWPRAYWRLGTAFCASALSSPWTVIPMCRAQVLVARGHGRAHQRCRVAE